MDTPKQGVHFLESFPPDLWAYLAWYLPGEQLGRLMITGAKFLWQRLKSSGVVKSIKLGKDFLRFKSWPSFLNDFPSLEELSIDSGDLQWSHELGLTIALIPSGVRKLELTGFWSNSVATLFGEPGGTFKLCEHLPRLEILNLTLWRIEDCSWMAHAPRTLTRLRTARWDGTVELPPSLIHVEIDSINLTASSLVSKLPSSLESVIASNVRGVDLFIRLLPPSIRKLRLDYWPEYSGQNGFEDELCGRYPTDCSPNIRRVSLLPPNLTTLEFNPELPCSAWHLLPQQVTNLSIFATRRSCTVASKIVDDHGIHHEAHSIPFDTLPRSITGLSLTACSHELIFCAAPAIFNDSYFPPQLTSLTIPEVQLSPNTAKLLPQSLTYLEMGALCEQLCKPLPAGLQTLISHTALMTPNLIQLLPKSLTVLELTQLIGLPQFDKWFDPNTGEKFSSLSELPGYPIHKSCLSNSFDWKNYSPLPPNITSLCLTIANELGDSFLLHQQLRNLLKLTLDSEFLTDLSIHHLRSSHLTTLNLKSSSKISGKSFEFLPRCLTHLNLDSSESIFDSEIQHLPRTLKHAYLNAAIHLTDLCIPDLPPHLKRLEMSNNSHITPSSFSFLPYPLRSIQFYKPGAFANWDVNYGSVCEKRREQDQKQPVHPYY